IPDSFVTASLISGLFVTVLAVAIT
ncbi:hypothetical protein CP8484711_0960, partial [Chlamydia psittaci 84-8471/1]